MANDEQAKYSKIMHDLHESVNKLRKQRGESPMPYVVPEPPFCSFCGKGNNEVFCMLSAPSPDILICDECVEKAGDLIAEKRNAGE